MTEKERKGQIWLAFASAAVAGLSQVHEEQKNGEETLLDPTDIDEFACDIADSMLDSYESRFGPGGNIGRRKTKRSRKIDEDEDDDEENEDEDD